MIPSIEKLMGLSRRFWNGKEICNFLGKSLLEEKQHMWSEEPWAHLPAGPGITAESTCPWASRWFTFQPLVSHQCQLFCVLPRVALETQHLQSVLQHSANESIWRGPPLPFTLSSSPHFTQASPAKCVLLSSPSPIPLHSHTHPDFTPSCISGFRPG